MTCQDHFNWFDKFKYVEDYIATFQHKSNFNYYSGKEQINFRFISYQFNLSPDSEAALERVDAQLSTFHFE